MTTNPASQTKTLFDLLGPICPLSIPGTTIWDSRGALNSQYLDTVSSRDIGGCWPGRGLRDLIGTGVPQVSREWAPNTLFCAGR